MIDAIERMQYAGTPWTPVGERLPPDREFVIVAYPWGVTSGFYNEKAGHWRAIISPFMGDEVMAGATHWMPFPSKPEVSA